MRFRPIEARDAEWVVRWRNANRDSFFDNRVVTTDTHLEFMRNRRLHDLIWIVEDEGVPVGMAGLRVDVEHCIAEYRMLLVGDEHKGKGYGEQIEREVMKYAFDVLKLDYLWGDYLESNKAIGKLHEKTGWTIEGIDLPGHTHERGRVVHIGYHK